MRLLLLLLAAYVAVAAATALPHGTSPRVRFAEMRLARRSTATAGAGHFSTAKELIASLETTPTGSWTTHAKAQHAVNVLRAIFLHGKSAVSAGANGACFDLDVAKEANNHAVVGTGSAEAKALCRYVDAIRENFENNDAELAAAPTVRVQGGGPAGLSAALYAKMRASKWDGAGRPLATVHVAEARHSYVRAHSVDVVDLVGTIGRVVIHGVNKLMTAIGADRVAEIMFPYSVASATKGQITTCNLEKHLALAAMIVGVEFSFGALKAKGDTQLTKNELFRLTSKPAGPVNWATHGIKCAAAPGGRRVMSAHERAAYDVHIGADGANSAMRSHDPLFKRDGNNPEFTPFDAGGDGIPVATLEKYGGLVSVAFVVDAGDCADAAARFTYDDKTALTGGPFSKPSGGRLPDGQCMLELGYKELAGQRIGTAFGSSCSWNFNRHSETFVPESRKVATVKLLQLTEEILAEAWPAGDTLTRFHDHVVEIKVYTVGFRASQRDGAIVVGAYDGPKKKLALLIGDAAREALPDGGMGANDAHHTAKQAIGHVRKWDKDADKAADKAAAVFTDLGDHAKEVCTSIQAKAMALHMYTAPERVPKKGANIPVVTTNGHLKIKSDSYIHWS